MNAPGARGKQETDQQRQVEGNKTPQQHGDVKVAPVKKMPKNTTNVPLRSAGRTGQRNEGGDHQDKGLGGQHVQHLGVRQPETKIDANGHKEVQRQLHRRKSDGK